MTANQRGVPDGLGSKEKFSEKKQSFSWELRGGNQVSSGEERSRPMEQPRSEPGAGKREQGIQHLENTEGGSERWQRQQGTENFGLCPKSNGKLLHGHRQEPWSGTGNFKHHCMEWKIDLGRRHQGWIWGDQLGGRGTRHTRGRHITGCHTENPLAKLEPEG